MSVSYAGCVRIVSLVPSLTELVWELAPETLVARTRFCIVPEAVREVRDVGGTKNPDVAAIRELEPDLVITNKEENRREDVEALRAAGLDVLLTDPNTVDEALEMMAEVGARLGAPARAAEFIADARAALAEPLPERRLRVFVPIWHEPLMALGSNSYGHDLIERCGAINVLAGRDRYPTVTRDEARVLRPDLVLLPDEPYRFSERHIPLYRAIAPARVVPGEWLWWYGPRIGASVRALKHLLSSPLPPASV